MIYAVGFLVVLCVILAIGWKYSHSALVEIARCSDEELPEVIAELRKYFGGAK